MEVSLQLSTQYYIFSSQLYSSKAANAKVEAAKSRKGQLDLQNGVQDPIRVPKRGAKPGREDCFAMLVMAGWHVLPA